ncbi:MAG: glycosyltransferase family 39 protein [Zoogloeaceae bacterium]|nr:glycosyltransferase family 39 protein [Zoogloeaceae bacterium]
MLVFAALCLYIVLGWDQHGISNDEEVQHVYGRLLVDFYASGLRDHAAFTYKNLYLYGGFFDLVAAGLERALPGSISVWDMRHLLSAAFGLAGLGAVWQLARTLGGERAGLFALLCLTLTGAWVGGMFTHTKDVPFATCMVWALYFTTRIVANLPRPPWRWRIGLGVAVGCALGLRVGAVFAVFYLGLALLVATAALGPRGDRWTYLGRSIISLVPSGLIALSLMGLFWPWSVMAAGNLIEAATAFSHFSFLLHTIVDGTVYLNGQVPRTYLLHYLAVRLPEILLLGLILLAVLAPFSRRDNRGKQSERWANLFPLLLAAGFPIAFTLATQPALYNGTRHFLFVVPPLAVLAGLGWNRLADFGRAGALLAGAAVVGLVAFHTLTLARLHPFEYVAYNQLAGGLPGAQGKWETDYWGDTIRPAASRLTEYVARQGLADKGPWPVAVCAESIQAATFLGPEFEVTRDWRRADFFISPTHMNCDSALKGQIVATVERAGVTLAVVKDRRALVGDERTPR